MKKLLGLVMAIITVNTASAEVNFNQDQYSFDNITALEVPQLDAEAFRESINSRDKEKEIDMSFKSYLKKNYTWMRTNPGVKPYKFMDDMSFVGIPLFIAGIIAKSEKSAFRQNDGTRHTLLTDFKTGIDDYTQFFGPALTVGLKVGGVEGRSDWGRFLASAAMGYGAMALLVNTIKYTAKEMRPDGSSANSWPSGHTATAFVGATILHKEYGMTRSPWYSVAGYSVATATGVMRVLNNRHWVSDILSGAGIGIFAGELGYALSDLIFKGKGLLRNDLVLDHNIVTHPSFFSISMGMGFGTKNLGFQIPTKGYEGELTDLEFRTSTAVSVEGAYFFNKYFGLGARARVNASPIKGWNNVLDLANADLKYFFEEVEEAQSEDPEYWAPLGNIIEDAKFTIHSDHLTEFALDLGAYFNLPLSSRFALGSKLLIGRSQMQALDLDAQFSGQQVKYDETNDRLYNEGTWSHSWDYLVLKANNTMKFGTGISLTYAYKDNFAWKIFLDYDYARKTYTLEYNPYGFLEKASPEMYQESKSDPEAWEEVGPARAEIKKSRNTFVLGGSFAINF